MEDVLALAGLAVIGAGVARGAYFVAVGGFLTTAIGAFIVSVLASFVLSGVASVALATLSSIPALSGKLIFVRGALAAVAQPTLSGVALLGTILVVAYGASMVHNLIEDVTILLESHREVVPPPPRK